ncbi:lysophospholipid acyltransferase family protein [Nonomuraea africana]|uniref:1-acyl-sn-glycerol-3-phosphate acyltransferase n=1 Tax=Nonomuraea africana TaxID=46171 RepID=A0ABR9KS34_9ACTN|nr:lysophospholipid acyltransferase family protein [Nonomuraea africana]MBE1564845.1 1-acyl-sn-glycerol-3-phosphate acyltransferase [Nonomuraea africana]
MSPWFPSSPCTTARCVDVPMRAAGPLRRALRALAAVLVVLVGLPAARLAPRTARRRVTMLWSRALLRALGVRIEVRQGFAFFAGAADPASSVAPDPVASGPEARLVVANHISWLDPLVVAATMPCRLVAKSEVGSWPVVGGLANGSGALPIARDSLLGLPGAVARIADVLRSGESVAAFPEGTTWCGRGSGTFKPAVFQAALDAGVPVTPVALAYRESSGPRTTAPAYVGDDTLAASLLRVIAVRRLVVEVTVLPPVTASGRRELADLAEAAVASATGRLPALRPALAGSV